MTRSLAGLGSLATPVVSQVELLGCDSTRLCTFQSDLRWLLQVSVIVIIFYFTSRIPAIDETLVGAKFGVIIGGLCIVTKAHLRQEIQDSTGKPY
jgi:hypothetical protein